MTHSRLTRTVVLIHGAWMTAASWSNFRKPFEEAGYTVHAPSWPFLDRGAAELRANPPADLGSLKAGDIADHIAKFIETLPEKPIIIGHSMGGLVTQLLLDRGYGVAGVLLDSGPVAGIIADPVSLLAALPVLARWNAWNRTYTLSKAQFDAKFANTAPAALRDEAYEKYMVPTSGRVFAQTATGLGIGINIRKRTQPVLVTAASEDKTVAPAMSRKIYKKHKKAPSRTDYVEFAGMSHFLMAEPGYEKVAAFIIEWAKDL
ncbi:alpha/beta fold hydrolase [Mesorhizobium sp. WSM3860]|uniref:alpha/beta hydrolase n=1 Tax=Mesorhizobium sp. WSM3860 TaxID=2029403 RepID=UPI000BAF07B2|nr:alpha/beta fold hydrolase [Mesorhizobium sp. WSM3860]PBC01904.1 alpha/beta hydrolase [Mesorhizobium sp. WSM3860]